MHRIFPAWHILWHLQLIPHGKHDRVDPDQRRTLVKRCLALVLILTTFVTAFLHEGIIWLKNQQLSDLFLNSGNRIVLLLTCSRAILTLLHICLTTTLFLWRAGGIPRYVGKTQTLSERLGIGQTEKHRHRRIFVCLFFVPVFINAGRLLLFLVYLMKLNWLIKPVSYEVLRVSQGVASFAFEWFAEILGSTVTLSIILQVASCARILRECLKAINTRLKALRDRVDDPKDHEVEMRETEREVLEIRVLYEALVKLFCRHEATFSLQILGAIMTTSMTLFAQLSSFFKPDLTVIGVAIYAMGFTVGVYVLFIMCVFPIQLYEESLRTSETLQEIIHKRQLGKNLSYNKPENQMNPREDDPALQLLFSFLQRSITKPLAVSAGSFVYITRSFLITVTAVMAGFLLFIIERVENQQQRSAMSCNCRNSSLTL
ncbi:hypothetical protein BV898_09854 [Hypsibius exemplaris]|uniref:Gustatory receptor n=1 Tax=Hypsibius exemplaris TaxID=2072580 RepID=A0A1W0WL31_HYPEX|nr:hypothetical protein BV898_09854 [Hypsibius exemplaris]